MRTRSFWACLASLALAAVAPAQTYTLKFKYVPDVGKDVVVKDSARDTGSVKVTDADGNVLAKKDKDTNASDEVYTETVLEKGDDRSRKFKRVYQKATRTADGRTTARSYEGRTVVFELKGDKYAVTVEGDKPLDKADLAELTRKANEDSQAQEQVFLPKKAVKVGDSWKIDYKELARAYGTQGNLDPENTSGGAKLVKVYEKDGKQFGVIELKLKLGPRPPKNVTVVKPVVAEMTVTFDGVIDGSSTEASMTMSGKMTGKTAQDERGTKITVEFNREVSGKKEQSAEK